MKDIYLVNYSVKGIKSLDQLVSLSFYKKTISPNPDTQEYNIKGIYGMNGSGKSGIVTSVDILRNILINPGYLSNPIVQKDLDEIINKKTGKIFIEADYIVKLSKELLLYRYDVEVSKNIAGRYVIFHESLAYKKATSKSERLEGLFEISDGEVIFISNKQKTDSFPNILVNKTMNLLTTASLCAIFYERFLLSDFLDSNMKKSILVRDICTLYILGRKLQVYIEQSDNHREYITRNSLEYYDDSNKYKRDSLINSYLEVENTYLNVISITDNIVPQRIYPHFEENVQKLYDFLHIFKTDLRKIEIDKKENGDFWICDLVMVYQSYKIHAEFESTGIKKLIHLFAYLKDMAQGGIVFIDELDSNLHDVYLCALLEYLAEYGEGQLCFTTHNVGPMDVLKQRKKSIDFLSENHKIYPWTTNGNYSPSKLYRNGMIEGSPFNVDSIDFIGVFESDREGE